MIHCVTTMSRGYYNKIGKYMIQSWIKFCPENYRLHLYLEDFSIDVTDNRIILENWADVSQMLDHFNDNVYHGSVMYKHGFTLKALTQIVLFKKLQGGKVFWIDADVVFLKTLPDDFFDSLIESYPLAGWGEYSLESGTVWFDLDHPDWHSIQKEYESIYLGPRGLPDGERWFDGELLGRAVRDSGVTTNNLRKLTTKKTSTHSNHAWTGKYLRHFKAKGKKEERFLEELRKLNLDDFIIHVQQTDLLTDKD